ncbi:MAG: YkgJ family cysteine cluster protein [Candidatus Melainabacteria bacterium]
MPASTAITEFRAFRDRIDALTREAWELYKGQMACKKGCSACCRGDFNITVLEGWTLKAAVDTLPEATRTRIAENLKNLSPERCPLLLDDACSVYAERPVLCRVFGFPVSSGQAIATCELNFTEAQASGMDLSARCFNQPAIAESLEAFSRLWLVEQGYAVPPEATLPVVTVAQAIQQDSGSVAAMTT